MQKLVRFLLWTGGIAIVLAVAARLLLFVAWVVPDDPLLVAAAAPTLAAGDTVLVLTRGTPGFGDLVRCPDPDDPNRWVVGRIVGLAGDTVELRGRSLRVNGTRYDSTDACKEPYFTVKHPDSGHELEMQCARVEMGGGWHYRGSSQKYKRSNDKVRKVGEGKVFLLSDDRDLHDDSRDFGSLAADSCRQRVVFRLWGAAGWTDSQRRLEVVR